MNVFIKKTKVKRYDKWFSYREFDKINVQGRLLTTVAAAHEATASTVHSGRERQLDSAVAPLSLLSHRKAAQLHGKAPPSVVKIFANFFLINLIAFDFQKIFVYLLLMSRNS